MVVCKRDKLHTTFVYNVNYTPAAGKCSNYMLHKNFIILYYTTRSEVYVIWSFSVRGPNSSRNGLHLSYSRSSLEAIHQDHLVFAWQRQLLILLFKLQSNNDYMPAWHYFYGVISKSQIIKNNHKRMPWKITVYVNYHYKFYGCIN